MDSNKPSFIESAGGWDGVLITVIAFTFIAIGCWLVANGHGV
ncbi:MAG TPA: hypothetical protein VK806_11765 [Bacteroidia bacterium]|jgi:hypothetical protein|nr:hypothetical protein [Bacteroidia bacterium]